ncbi:hypothetical protein NWE55_09915 [Myroides albus]|uniref:hypothetical protein n=1 Tax=Myroides albus TaxID=2562892 RepID=UPI0021594E30|nr:hypothetical protein [Myroides albus]UVD78451.1 hypothetical protein NWE55_09915 [Myroides albus]
MVRKTYRILILLNLSLLTLVSCEKSEIEEGIPTQNLNKQNNSENSDEPYGFPPQSQKSPLGIDIDTDEAPEKDWGLPPIKPPTRPKSIGTDIDTEEAPEKDWGLPPIKPPTRPKSIGTDIDTEEAPEKDWGLPPIKPPTRPTK